ncbi:MAG TPA: glycerol-3-phosphate 1-O-acyltransferase PlsY [Gaiellaceae bacterium]|nr:glycerol-3-phosphate 1-O-acyltransferase PlsY [Gaiellaceae bacterium]
MLVAALIVAGYVLGSCPWGYWLVRIFRHEDIRKTGSGNIGGTNVWRVYGAKLGAPVIFLDVVKGFVPALLGVLLVSHFVGILAGAAAMAGHWRPLFLRFARGGKVIATGGGVFFAVAPLVALTGLALWIAFFWGIGYASVASVVVALFTPFGAWLYGYPRSVIVFGAFTACAAAYLHRANFARLRAGTEARSGIALLPRLRGSHS